MKRKIILNLAISIDGFIADEDGGFAWIIGDGDNKTNTENYVNKYVGNAKSTPSVDNRYLKSSIRVRNRSFQKNRIRYLDGKTTKRLFRENFANNKKHKMVKSKLIKRLGLIFRVAFLIVFVSLMFFIIQDSFKNIKFTTFTQAKSKFALPKRR